MLNSELLSPVTVAVVAALVLCTVAATVIPSVRAANGWNGGGIPSIIGDQKSYPSLAYTSNGDPRVAYYDGYLWYGARVGGTWSSKKVDSTGGAFCALTLKNNLPWISYYDTTNHDLKCAWMDAKNVWHYEGVDTVGDVGRCTSIVIAPDGQPRISYFDFTNANLKYAYRTTSGKWVKQTVDAAGLVGGLTSIAINPVTKGVGISYYDMTHRDLKYAYKNPGMATWKTTFADKSPGDVGQFSSLAFTSAGEPRIAYYDVTHKDLKYAAKAGATWYYKTFPTAADDGHYPSLILSNKGLPRIISRDFTNERFLFTWKDTKGVWHTEVAATNNHDITFTFSHKDVSIAIYKPTGKTGICYDIGWQIKITPHWYQNFFTINFVEKTYPFN